jgi:hypothetical protein
MVGNEAANVGRRAKKVVCEVAVSEMMEIVRAHASLASIGRQTPLNICIITSLLTAAFQVWLAPKQ